MPGLAGGRLYKKPSLSRLPAPHASSAAAAAPDGGAAALGLARATVAVARSLVCRDAWARGQAV